MKKIVLASALSLGIIFGSKAQNPAANTAQDKIRIEFCKSLSKDLQTAEKKTQDPKKGIKASTWIDLAKIYQECAQNSCDSMASEKAYQTFKKAEEVDKASGGKSAKEIAEALKSQRMYNLLMSQGATYYNAKNNVNAVKLFNLASLVNPKDSTAALYRGIAGQQAKDYESAKKGFMDFIDLGGKDPAVFFSLVQILKLEKNNAKVIEMLKKGIATNPNDKDLKAELVNANLAGGNTNEAINDLKKIVEADPTNVSNLLNLGILYDNSGKKEEALSYYKKVIELEPNNYDCNYNMGVFKFNEAVELKKIVDKMDMKTYQKEGKAVEEKVCAKFSEAKPYFEKCKSVKPNESEVNENLTNLQGVLEQCGKRK